MPGNLARLRCMAQLPPLLIETTRYDRFGRNSSMKSRPASPCQRGGRRFAAELRSASASRAKPACEPGLVLQEMERPDRSCDRAFLVRVMVGGLLGPLPPPAHPQQRHQAAQPRGQREGSGSNTMSAPPIEDTERSARARPLRG